jgi:uncharacterized protein (DUF697 family)
MMAKIISPDAASNDEVAKSETPTTSTVDVAAIDKIIKKWTIVATGSGFVPVPLLDLAALAAVQMKMVHEIGREHGHDFSANVGKSSVSAAITSLAAPTLAGLGASLIKIVPVIGPVVGKLSFHGYAAASTYAMGKLFHHHFASGGNILSFNPMKMRAAYKEHMATYKAEAPVSATA